MLADLGQPNEALQAYQKCHDLLAEIYLRRGFLDSAADEWIAAVEEDGPDPASLGGLARVAAARGLSEDAEMFAQGAKELDSSSV